LLPVFLIQALRAFRGLLPHLLPWEPAIALSRQERLGLIWSAIDRCGTDCPACVIWALEQDRWQTALD
jgi:hypothetical protein